MNNYQLNNTSIYLGGQCKWDLILKDKDGKLYVDDFQLSPLSPVIPYSLPIDNYLINYDHGFNLKTFYEMTHGDFWNNNYIIDPLSGYDISRYSGCRRRQTFSSYHKQFEYLQPLWLESINENQYLRFDFECYTLSKDNDGNPVKGILISRKSLDLTEGDGGYHKGFVNYFNKWLSKNNIRYSGESGGNNKVGYVSFEDRQMLISGIDVTSGESAGVVDVSYMLSNFLSYERPLIETDNMITELFKNYRLVAYQLFNFNFCFDIKDLVNANVYNIIKGKPVTVDCMVSIVNGDTSTPLVRRSLFTNYEYIKKAQTNNFTIVAGTVYDGDSLEETYQWDPSDSTDYNLTNGYLSTNVLDYLKDYKYPSFSRVNKLTQDIIHWGYTQDSTRTFNIYKGFRGLLQSPTLNTTGRPVMNDNGNYLYDLAYDDGSNGVSTSTALDTYGATSNGLAWIQPGRVLWSQGSDDLNKIIYYTSDYINKYGVSVRDIAAFWNVDIEQLNIYKNDDEDVNEYIGKYDKILLIYAADGNLSGYNEIGGTETTGKEGIHGYKYNNNLILVTNNLDNFMLCNWIRGRDDSEETTVVEHVMEVIDTIVYVGNMNVGIRVGTEINPVINATGELEYRKSENHTAPLWRHSGEITPFVVERDDNYIYNIDIESNTIVKKEGVVEVIEPENEGDGKEYKTPIEFLWKDVCRVIEMLNDLKFKETLLPGESWMNKVKDDLGNLYGIDDEDEKEYIFNLYDYNINYTHESADVVNYEIKLTLL